MTSCSYPTQAENSPKLFSKFSNSTHPSQGGNVSNLIKFKVINFGYSPLEENFEPDPKVLVFRDKKTWSKFWNTISILDLNLQKPPVPKFNFEEKMIIGLTSGSKTTGGYKIRINKIESFQEKQGRRWIIHYTEIRPDESCILTQKPTTPNIFISTDKSDIYSIDLQGKKMIYSCSN
ncbi:MAG: protease complex subunit PrcB family protein [Mastigocoleus sp. MO_188.B34]|nr:protease complex subunit PrcB family protein [Mastigocoleus sp. MO_188.B34]